MQAIVRTHHIKIEADSIPKELLAFLKKHYGEVTISTSSDEELIEVRESSWYRDIKNQLTAGENVKFYRELNELTQTELGKQLGGIPRQNISNIEHNRRAISKETARKLSKFFNVTIDKFI